MVLLSAANQRLWLLPGSADFFELINVQVLFVVPGVTSVDDMITHLV